MKTSVSLRAPRLVALLAFAFASLSVSTLSAQNATVSTVPVGYMSQTLTPGTIGSPKYTAISLPLVDGILYRGTISAVTSNTTLTVSPTVTDTFSNTSSTPALLKLTTGSHAGRTFIINSNSGSTLTINNDGTPLTTLSPAINVGASGDNFIIYGADTLNGYFGNRTFGGVAGSTFSAANGNAQAAAADQVWIWNPATSTYSKYYYYNNGNGTGNWRAGGFNTISDNVILRPDAGILYLRRGSSAFSVDVTGEVPLTGTQVRVRDSGNTYVASSIPANTTLLGLGLHNEPSWVIANQTTNPTSTTVNSFDQVWIWNTTTGVYNKYYYNAGTVGAVAPGWKAVGFNTLSNNLAIAAGTPVFIKKAALGQTTFSTVTLDLPAGYNPLN